MRREGCPAILQVIMSTILLMIFKSFWFQKKKVIKKVGIYISFENVEELGKFQTIREGIPLSSSDITKTLPAKVSLNIK